MLAVHCNRLFKCPGWNSHDFWTLMFRFSPQIINSFGNHMMIIRIHGPFICSHWIIMYSFQAISVKLDCNTTHPSWVSPHYCPWTNTQYDNTHINKAQMEKHLKKTIESRTRFGTGKEWPKIINTMKCQLPDNPLTTYQQQHDNSESEMLPNERQRQKVFFIM